MKQFIYLDDIVLNSLLAQIDKGLVSSQQQTTQGQETHTKAHDLSIEVGAGVSSTQITSGGKHNTSDTEVQMSSETTNVIWNDYAVEQLIAKSSIEKSKDISDLSDGSLFLLESKVNSFNFSEISKIINSKSLETLFSTQNNEEAHIQPSPKQIKDIKKKKTNKLPEGFKDAQKIFEFGNESFGDSQIFVEDSGQCIMIGKTSKNRLSNAQMQMINGTTIPITILGIKRSSFDSSVLTMFDGDFLESEIGKTLRFPQFFQNLYLQTFGLINDDGAMVEPIALYFDVPDQNEF